MKLALASALLTACHPAIHAFSPSFQYGSQKVRGVSLGGWLVIEVCMHALFARIYGVLTRLRDFCVICQPWITPSLFDNTNNTDIVDEWTFGQLQDRTVAEKTLKAHWDSWITEADFVAIAAAGFVRASKSNLHIVHKFVVYSSA